RLAPVKQANRRPFIQRMFAPFFSCASGGRVGATGNNRAYARINPARCEGSYGRTVSSLRTCAQRAAMSAFSAWTFAGARIAQAAKSAVSTPDLRNTHNVGRLKFMARSLSPPGHDRVPEVPHQFQPHRLGASDRLASGKFGSRRSVMTEACIVGWAH